MTTQQYLMISKISNVVENVCVWDGDINTWQPPVNILMLEQANTPTMVWQLNKELSPPDYVLVEQIGGAEIDFTWDGSVLTTNQPKPTPPTPKSDQPTTTGTTTI